MSAQAGHGTHASVEAAQLSEVAPGVYSYVQPDGTWFINNMGFIAGSSAVVSIDTTSTERRNRAYLEAIASVTSNPVRVVVNTHHHADHTHGNYQFTDATIISHAKCRDVMMAAGIPDYSAVFPGVEWGDLQFRAPDVTFEGSMVLYLDDRRIELSDLGFVAHTDGDIVAWLPDCRVLFCGDLIFHGGTPFALFGSVAGTIQAMDVIESFGAEVIVPGHGPHFGGDDIARVLDEQRSYLRFVQEAAAEGIAAGRTPLEQAQATDLGPHGRYTDPERLAGNLHVAYREAASGGYEFPGVPQAIMDMVAYNGGALPRCVA